MIIRRWRLIIAAARSSRERGGAEDAPRLQPLRNFIRRAGIELRDIFPKKFDFSRTAPRRL